MPCEIAQPAKNALCLTLFETNGVSESIFVRLFSGSREFVLKAVSCVCRRYAIYTSSSLVLAVAFVNIISLVNTLPSGGSFN